MCLAPLSICCSTISSIAALANCKSAKGNKKFFSSFFFIFVYIAAFYFSFYAPKNYSFGFITVNLCPNRKNVSVCYSDQLFIRIMGSLSAFYLLSAALSLMGLQNKCCIIKYLLSFVFMGVSLYIDEYLLYMYIYIAILASSVLLLLQNLILTNFFIAFDKKFQLESCISKLIYTLLMIFCLAAAAIFYGYLFSFYYKSDENCSKEIFFLIFYIIFYMICCFFAIYFNHDENSGHFPTLFLTSIYCNYYVLLAMALYSVRISNCSLFENESIKFLSIPSTIFTTIFSFCIAYFFGYDESKTKNSYNLIKTSKSSKSEEKDLLIEKVENEIYDVKMKRADIYYNLLMSLVTLNTSIMPSLYASSFSYVNSQFVFTLLFLTGIVNFGLIAYYKISSYSAEISLYI